jgi:putative acetyltransferase
LLSIHTEFMNDKSVHYQDFSLRPWQPRDRQAAADLISQVLVEYGLGWEPEGADRDVLEVEACYLNRNGAFYVEAAIASAGFGEIWIETASILKEGVALYESSGYEPASGVETLRCDRVYRKGIADSDRTPH